MNDSSPGPASLPDFPAAHSMDTTWFAVDRDGHVASFESGEAGAVPVHAAQSLGLNQAALAVMLPRCEVIHDLQGRSLPREFERMHLAEYAIQFPTLMFLTSLDPVRNAVEEGQAVQVPTSNGVGVMFRQLPGKLYKTLHDAGACLGCFWFYPEQEDGITCAQLGIYDYEHLCENWISGPYGRADIPVQPIHVDQLPPVAREHLKQFRFDSLCFAETPHIQPVGHSECNSWESEYLLLDGKTQKPMPRREHGDE